MKISSQEELFDLVERFRAATGPADVARLGDELGGTVFGNAPREKQEEPLPRLADQGGAGR